MINLNNKNSRGSGNSFLRSFDDAVELAEAVATETGQPRYVHHGMYGFAVLHYPTPGTVVKAEPAVGSKSKRAGA